MFILDTNVLSSLMAVRPEPRIAAWVDARPRAELFTVAVCQAEILAGLAIMPVGRRRRALEAAARSVFAEGFGDRVLSFDAAAAVVYADLFASRRRAGRPVAPPDLMIAAIARLHGASVVTRNTSDFEGCGIALVNPWT